MDAADGDRTAARAPAAAQTSPRAAEAAAARAGARTPPPAREVGQLERDPDLPSPQTPRGVVRISFVAPALPAATRRPRGHRTVQSPVRSRPEMYLGSAKRAAPNGSSPRARRPDLPRDPWPRRRRA